MVLMNLFARQQWRNRRREQTYGHRERGGEDEMYGKSNMETYITICKIESQPSICCMAQETQTGAIYFTYGNVSFHVTLSIHLILSSPFPMSISLFCLFLHCCPVNKFFSTIFIDSMYVC